MKYLLAVLAFVSTSAFSQWSVQIHGLSRHSGTAQYNEVNQGVSIRYEASDDVSYQAGSYLNSYNRQTTFAAINYTPLHFGRVSLGGFAGVGTGYYLPVMAGGAAVVSFDRMNVTFRVIPKISRDTDGVVSVEIGFKF